MCSVAAAPGSPGAASVREWQIPLTVTRPRMGRPPTEGARVGYAQQRRAHIIRPQSEYTGPRDRTWVPLAERVEPA
jgi:hypothetical protein